MFWNWFLELNNKWCAGTLPAPASLGQRCRDYASVTCQEDLLDFLRKVISHIKLTIKYTYEPTYTAFLIVRLAFLEQKERILDWYKTVAVV